jgi:hypothetical protein
MSEEVEHRLDEFARAIAAEHHTRRHVLKLGLGALGAAIAAALPGRASAHHNPGHGGGAGAECDEVCKAVNAHPPGRCKSACVDCRREGGVFCPTPTPHCCDPGEICCQTGGCLGRCPRGTVPDPVRCRCRPAVVECSDAPGGVCPADSVCCTALEPGEGARCCPPDTICCAGSFEVQCCPIGTACVLTPLSPGRVRPTCVA